MPGNPGTEANIIINTGSAYHNVTGFADATSLAIGTADGAPAAGTHFGYTEGDCAFTIGFDVYEAVVNEHHGPIIAALQNQFMQATLTIDEVEDANLDKITNGFSHVASNVVYHGSTALPAPFADNDGFLYSIPIQVADSYWVFAIYDAYYPNAVEIACAALNGLHMLNVPVTVRALVADIATFTSANMGYVDPSLLGTI